jgi:hypothetical protein
MEPPSTLPQGRGARAAGGGGPLRICGRCSTCRASVSPLGTARAQGWIFVEGRAAGVGGPRSRGPAASPRGRCPFMRPHPPLATRTPTGHTLSFKEHQPGARPGALQASVRRHSKIIAISIKIHRGFPKACKATAAHTRMTSVSARLDSIYSWLPAHCARPRA